MKRSQTESRVIIFNNGRVAAGTYLPNTASRSNIETVFLLLPGNSSSHKDKAASFWAQRFVSLVSKIFHDKLVFSTIELRKVAMEYWKVMKT